jgi:peptidoglycan/LPS O-acetylase OafA/YrhL
VLYLVLKIFKRNYPAVFLGCILTGVAVRLGIYMIHQPWSGDNGFCDMQLSVSGHIIYYLSGMALAFMEKEKPVTVSKTRIFLIILSVIFWWFTAGYLYGNTGVFQTAILFYLPCLTVVCISAYLLIFNSETLRRSFSKSPIIGGLQKTGRLSFHLYLWHWTVILVVWRYIRLPASVNTYYGILAAALLITFILSLATYFLFDKPFSRRKKR